MGPISYHTKQAKLNFYWADKFQKSANKCKGLTGKNEYQKQADKYRELGNYHSLQLKLI